MSTKSSVARSTTSKAPVKAPSKPKPPIQTKKSQLPQDRGNWISRSIQGWVANIGSAVGGGANAVGNSVSNAGQGIGDSVTNATRGWADEVRRWVSSRLPYRQDLTASDSYGNAIKDATGATGTRTVTGSNPLGLGGQMGNQRAGKEQRNAGGGTASNPLGLK